MVSVRAIFAYIVYAVLVAVLFLVVLFPSQAVKAVIDARLTAIDPALTMLADSIRPAFPPGLQMSRVDLNHDTVRLAHFDQARLSPDLASLLQEKKQVRFQARLADGMVNGRAIMTDAGPSGPVQVEADLSDVRLEQLDTVKALTGLNLFGSLKGRITHEGSHTPGGITNASLNLTELRITLAAPFYGISDIVSNQTDVEFSVSGTNLRLKSLTFDGPMLEGKISGIIELRSPIAQSRLNLTGNAKPRSELFARLQETIPQGLVNLRSLETRGVTFRIRGSIDSPDVSMR
jgi:type II secretion system protein N